MKDNNKCANKKSKYLKGITAHVWWRWFIESLSFWDFENVDLNLNLVLGSTLLWFQRRFAPTFGVPTVARSDLDTGW